MTTYSNIRYAAAGVTEYATANDLPNSAAAGSQAFVADNNRLYIWNGTGWYNIALINTNPSISGVSSSYDLAQDGTATTVTIVASDPEGLPITYSLASDTSGSTATVVQGTGASTNVFTITPSTSDANAGTFTLTFRASDGVNIATAPAEFSLAFQVANSQYTSALITSVGADNAVNNAFIDSSSNSHTITVSGDAHQSTFSPYRHGGYSARFTGSASYFATDNTSVIGTGDFTWEAWVKTTDDAGTLWMKYNGGNQADGISLTAGVVRTHLDVGLDPTTGSINIADGNWHYIVVERYNGTLKTFVDGTQDSSTSNSENASRTGAWFIGKFGNNGAVDWAGEIRDLRFSHNTAEYQGSLSSSDIPTETVTARASTTITLFTGKPYFENGTPTSVISDPTSPYAYNQYSSPVNGGSMSFDGNSDAIEIADNDAFDFGTGDLTIECWVYPKETGNSYPGFLGSVSGWGSQAASGFRFDNLGDSKFQMSWYGPGDPFIESQSTFNHNQWHHFVVTRTAGNTWRMFVNGILEDVGTNSTAYDICVGGTNFQIGGKTWDGGNGWFNGNVADVRLTKGSVVTEYQTSSTTVGDKIFTPRTTPMTTSGSELHIKGTNAGIIDKSQTAQAITLNGNVKSSTTQTKYLSSSMYFDGAGDYIEVVDDLGEFSNYSNATLEMWVYPTSSSGENNLIEKFTPASGPGWTLYMPSGSLNLQWYGGGITNSSTAMTINQWNHIAVVHHNGTRKIYVNGTGGTGVSFSSTISSNPMRIGARGGNGNWFDGYMSDIRIQLGRAIYTADFTPPTAALKG